MFRTLQFNTQKKSDIRNSLIFLYCVRIEHGAVSKTSYCQFHRKFTAHSETFKTPKGKNQRQNTNTMLERERYKWEMNLQLPTMVRAIQTIHEKEMQ